MTNAKYIKGRTFEYKIATFFRRHGFFVVRAAGSKGPADLVAVKKGRPTLLIQCKAGSGTVNMEEHNVLERAALEVGAIPIIASAEDRKPTVFKLITGIALKTGDEEKVIRSTQF